MGHQLLSALTLAAAVSLAGGVAQAEPVAVLGYNSSRVQAYQADGTPLPDKVPTSALQVPPFSSAATGPANTVGITYQGAIVFVRRLDLKLGPMKCLQMAKQAPRGPGVIQAGERLGAGDSQECIVQ